jgi:hypothetical protein
MKWILLGVLAVVLWYIVAPLITPRPLRPNKRRTSKKQDSDVIEGEGRIIE